MHKYKLICAKERVSLLSMQCYHVCFADVSLWSIDSVLKDQFNKRSYSNESVLYIHHSWKHIEGDDATRWWYCQ